MKKELNTNLFVTCNSFSHKKTYMVEEAKEKSNYAICPACGKYHRILKTER